MLARELADSPELAPLHDAYTEYALRDRHLPRPVLAYFGFHAFADAVDYSDVDRIGEALIVPQLLRDVLAIHDDIVDEDLDKFGAPPLPVALSGAEGRLTRRGKDLALYYGDFLVGVLHRVASGVPGEAGRSLVRLIADTLYVNQRGQLAELLAETKPLAETSVDDLLVIGERKAAHYCYSFPFRVGAVLAGHDGRRIEPVCRVLLKIGTASQVVDDITGTFPGVVDHDKDTLGEIANLRRTVPLVLLATGRHSERAAALLAAPTPLPPDDAARLREELWCGDVPDRALTLGRGLVDDITTGLARLDLGRAAARYLDDLVAYRLRDSLDRFERAIGRSR
ncbi:polyprenyl synthetase family protein [Saccharothrix violaceirubra]|uniref:Geranylgeranyl pyrophosphate synthase n=1 Tax=Saccharothrix violaceirubra TaxID=413306 RepID=A0A7W7WTS5_9PSEU|nr:polyprenyl synthetase family protein [Saccharothrix violaceirubra]MBB4963485.1 geranylgeranyl pyrophosphate synthase [Saccharothrix violaceirubra]